MPDPVSSVGRGIRLVFATENMEGVTATANGERRTAFFYHGKHGKHGKSYGNGERRTAFFYHGKHGKHGRSYGNGNGNGNGHGHGERRTAVFTTENTE